ncbi:hypothetical protein CDAR_244801, partial [Caerostris darwini]
EQAQESKTEAEKALESKDDVRAELDVLLEKVQSLYLKCGLSEMTTKAMIKPTEKEEGKEEEKKEEEIDEGLETDTPKYIEPKDDLLHLQKLEHEKIDDSNALEFNAFIEKKILEYLTLIEYIRMKETASDETPGPLLGADEDEPVISETPLVEYLDTIKPRLLRSKTDLRSISELNRVQTFLPLDQLKSKAMEAIQEIESEEGSDDDESSLRSGKKA